MGYLCGMKRWLFVNLCWLMSALVSLHAQERTDSLVSDGGLSQAEIDELTRPITPLSSSEMSAAPTVGGLSSSSAAADIPLSPEFTSRYQAPSVFRVLPEPSFYPSWDTGMLYGFSSQHNDWLRGYQAMAGVGLRQQFGDNWSLSANASVYKNSIYYNSATIDGRLTWRPSRYFGVTVFGSYSPGAFMSAVDLGQSFNWGGYVTLEGRRFGIDLGAQTYYDPFMGHDVEPIVQPFVKFGDAKLGIDIGPMLKNALQKDRRDGPGFNPIPQPVKAMPQIAPRR